MTDVKLNVSYHACLGGGGNCTQKQVSFACMAHFCFHMDSTPVSYVNKQRKKKDLNPTGIAGDFILLGQSKILRRFV